MTAWARSSSDLLAYSVRPDLWPPGWGDVHAGKLYLAYFGSPSGTIGVLETRASQACTGSAGVAESLVLGGLRYHPYLGRTPWIPCDAPGLAEEPT